MPELTYLIPSSQDFFIGFPHDKNVVIALDKVQPVPWVFLVLYLLLLKILISDYETNISWTIFEARCPPLINTLFAPISINL